MPYPAVPNAVVNQDLAYKQLAKQQAKLVGNNAKQAVQPKLESLGVQIEERLIKDMRVVKAYLETHTRLVKQNLTLAQAQLKQAKILAANYKKTPNQGALVTQLKNALQSIGQFETAATADKTDLVNSWLGYRDDPAANIPAKYKAGFENERRQIMSGTLASEVIVQQIRAIKHEGEALLHITDKAESKHTIAQAKQQGLVVDQRLLAVARQQAHDIRQQSQTWLNELQNPAGQTPNNITGGKKSLSTYAKLAAFPTNANELKNAHSLWTNIDVSYKLLSTRATNLNKVLATKKKGFHSNELKDKPVKDDLAAADRAATTAAKLLKEKTADYEAAKKSLEVIEARAKKKNIK